MPLDLRPDIGGKDDSPTGLAVAWFEGDLQLEVHRLGDGAIGEDRAPHLPLLFFPHGLAEDFDDRYVEDYEEQPPTDLVCSTFTKDTVEGMIAAGHPFFAGLDRRDYRVLELPTGHWPQFTRPADLTQAILGSLR